MRGQLVYFGTYTGGKSKGIYISRFDPTTGRLTCAGTGGGDKEPQLPGDPSE